MKNLPHGALPWFLIVHDKMALQTTIYMKSRMFHFLKRSGKAAAYEIWISIHFFHCYFSFLIYPCIMLICAVAMVLQSWCWHVEYYQQGIAEKLVAGDMPLWLLKSFEDERRQIFEEKQSPIGVDTSDEGRVFFFFMPANSVLVFGSAICISDTEATHHCTEKARNWVYQVWHSWVKFAIKKS